MTTQQLVNKVALVFGAGSARGGLSIGKATAVAFARAGAKVAAVDVIEKAAKETEQLIQAENGECEAITADATVSTDVKRAVDRCLRRFGRIDILQNNIGVAHLGGPVDMSEETWLSSMKLNVGSAFLACKHVLPVMESQAAGVITSVSSIASLRWVGIEMIGYSTFKAALNAFTQTVALQYAKKGIRANVIIPGRMDTPILRGSLQTLYANEQELIAEKAAMCPSGKLGDPWDVAAASVFLASDEAKYITGIALPVDGGVLYQS